MAKDNDYIKLINTSRWQRLRRMVLTKHPLCQRCQENGIVKAACEVHHITPIENANAFSDKESLAYNPNNLMALCHECHVAIHQELHYRGMNKAERKEYQQKKIDDKFFSKPG